MSLRLGLSACLVMIGCVASPEGGDGELLGPKSDRWSSYDARTRIRVGTWNIQRLGHQWNPDRSGADAWGGYDDRGITSIDEQVAFRDEVYDKLARVIDENFDLIAITEVKHHAPRPYTDDSDDQTQHIGEVMLSEAFERRRANGNDLWKRLMTSERRAFDEDDPNNAHAEYYAFYYRSPRVSPCPAWGPEPLFTNDDPGPLSSSDMRALCDDEPSNAFERDPAFACFEAGDFDFILAAFHASYFEGSEPTIRCEVRSLTKTLSSMREAAKEAGIPSEADLLIVGDFNLDHFFVDRARVETILPGPTVMNQQGCDPFVEGAGCDRTNRPAGGLGSTLSSDGQRTENLYDHLIVPNPEFTTELEGNASVLEYAIDRYYQGDGQTFFELASDHLPLVATFRIDRGDDD